MPLSVRPPAGAGLVQFALLGGLALLAPGIGQGGKAVAETGGSSTNRHATPSFLDQPVPVRIVPGPRERASASTGMVRSFTRSGRPCREYVQTVVIDNAPVHAIGTLCQQPDGTWQLR